MCDRTEVVLRAHQTRALGAELGDQGAWGLSPSQLGGRGVVAAAALQPGDLIFHDAPVLWGPRAKPDQPMCASCGRRGRVAQCAAGCCLPLCSKQCAESPQHTLECNLLRHSVHLPDGGWRLDLLGTVTPLRALFLSPEDREVVQCLQSNRGKIHGIEVDLLKQYMKSNLCQEDEEWMRQCCLAMDTNAFEFIKVFEDGAQSSLRGLYPLASIMNHSCSPNSCHVYNAAGTMRVFAARPIAEGEEITTSYTALVWSTAIRRLHLTTTKHFACRCLRCSDPAEFGSLLSSLPCPELHCSGLLLPTRPLLAASPWLCGTCGAEVSPKQAIQIQTAQAAVLQGVSEMELSEVAQLLTSVPSQGQVAVQLKMIIVWQMGHKPGYLFSELSREMLDLKEKYCRDTLHMLDLLRFGFCRLKGLVLLELHAALCEQIKRLNSDGISTKEVEEEMKECLSTSKLILENDAAAQKDVNNQIEVQMTLLSAKST